MLRAELSSTLEQLEDAEAAAQEAGSLLEQLRAVEQANLALKGERGHFAAAFNK